MFFENNFQEILVHLREERSTRNRDYKDDNQDDFELPRKVQAKTGKERKDAQKKTNTEKNV